MITPYLDGEYKIIQPSEVAEISRPEFDTRGRRSEEEYRQLLEDSQEYFKLYVANPNNKQYYIYEDCDAATVYIHNAVTVKKINGKYVMASNGRHRLYVAKKYNLPLLVCVRGVDTEDFDLSSGNNNYRWTCIKRFFMNLIEKIK